MYVQHCAKTTERVSKIWLLFECPRFLELVYLETLFFHEANFTFFFFLG